MFFFGGDSKKHENIKVEVDIAILKKGAELYKSNQVVGAIDQGTSSTRFVIFTPHGRIGASSQLEHKQIYPSGKDKVGWHEQDPLEIWENVVKCMEAVKYALEKEGIKLVTSETTSKSSFHLVSIGITNQRETTVAWNDKTGVPYHNAIIWDCLRTTSIAKDIESSSLDAAAKIRATTGLPIASYFAGTKVKWLLDNVPELAKDIQNETEAPHVRFGTIDTWLVYQLTGTAPAQGTTKTGCVGGKFITDVSNASRWLFLDISKIEWDHELVDQICSPHKLPISTCLPQVCKSSQIYANVTSIPAFKGVPIASILGDQQAALFGQCAFAPGEAKNTYGTGLFLMMNTGTKIVPSTHGLLTTIAYQIEDETVVYALEGSVSHSGSTIQWLRDQLQLIDSAPESETFATKANDGLYFVPAFAGLFAPYWRSDARGCIVGLTTSHHKGHICRAALEAAAYQTKELFDAMYLDSSVSLTSLRVDGGGTNNSLLMQFQADMIDVTVEKPVVMETTSLGAAFSAGLAVNMWKDIKEIKERCGQVAETYIPIMSEQERISNFKGWKKAVSKSLNWETTDDTNDEAVVTVGGDSKKQEANKDGSDNADKSRDVGIGSTPCSSGAAKGSTTLPLLIIVSVCALGVGYFLGRRDRYQFRFA